jgi:hypothetical protein
MGFWSDVRDRSIFTAAGLRTLYKDRQAVNPTEGNRTTTSMGLIAVLIVVLMSALFSLMWVQSNATAFLREQAGVRVFENGQVRWQVWASAPGACADGAGCTVPAEATARLFEGPDIRGLEIPNAPAVAGAYGCRYGNPAVRLLIKTKMVSR